ncbi:hypothetical protein D9M68_952920 [compost metagenome]
MPKDVWIIDAIPVTAVGKTFKPTLRFDATRRVLEEVLGEIAPGVRVEVVNDDRHGQIAEIHVPNLDSQLQERLEARMAGFSVKFRLMA